MEAVDQVFGANKAAIKQKTLEALRLLRQADHPLDKICKYLADRTEKVWNLRSTNISSIAKVKLELEMSSGKLTRKKHGCLSQLSLSYIWVRRVLWAVSTVLRMCVRRTRYISTIVLQDSSLYTLPLRHNGGQSQWVVLSMENVSWMMFGDGCVGHKCIDTTVTQSTT